MIEKEPAKSEGAADESEPLSELAEELSMAASDEDGERKPVELSSEQAEQLRGFMTRLQATMQPQVGLISPHFLGMSHSLRNRETATKTGWLALGESTMKGFTAISRLIGEAALPDSLLQDVLGVQLTSKAITNIVPAISVEPSWMKKIKLIDSDLYKATGLGQSNLTALSSILAKNADFSFNSSAAKLASQFASEQASWLKTIKPLLEKLKTGFYPTNLAHIADLAFEEVEAVVMLDGIALYGVPRTEIAEKIIRAETTQARRAILGRRWKAVSADCRAAVEGCSSAHVTKYVTFAAKALDALDNEHTEAAQALATSLIDTLINGHFGKSRYNYTPDMKGKRTTAEYQKLSVRQFIAFAPLWQAYQKFKAEDGDSIPRTFSRHASVHGVSPQQFSRRNAVQALLFVTGLLVFMDEEASALSAA